jgi:TP901 family phage tail tape measure protein
MAADEEISIKLTVTGFSDFMGDLRSAKKAADDFAAGINAVKFDGFSKGFTDAGQGANTASGHISTFADKTGGLIGKLGDLGGSAAKATVSGLESIGKSALGAVEGFVKLGVESAKTAASFGKNFVKSSVSAFAEFDQSLNTIKATATDVDDKVFKKLQDSAIDLGAKLPLSTKQVADGFVELSKAGFSADQILKGLGGATANLAVAGNLEVGKSAGILGSALRDFGKDAQDANHFAAVLATTANASAIDITDMNESLKYAGPIANAAGISFEETSQMIGILGNNMIKGSQAGTSLRSIITRVTTGAGHAGDAMIALGVSTTDSNGKMKPFSQTMEELRTKFAGMNEQQQLNYANQIAGQSAMTGFLTLMRTGKTDMDSMTNSIAGADKQFGSLTDTMQGSLGTKFENFKGSVEAVEIRLGRALAPAASLVVDKLSAMTNSLGPLVDKLGGPVQGAINGVSSLFEKMGTHLVDVHDGIQLFQEGMKGIKPPPGAAPLFKFVGDLGVNIGKIAPKVMAVTSAFNPLSLAMTSFQGFLNGGVNGAIDAFTGKIGKAGEALGIDLSGPLQVAGDIVKNDVLPIFSTIGTVFETDIEPAIGKFAKDALPPLKDAFDTVSAIIKNPVLPVLGELVKIFVGDILPTVIQVGDKVINNLKPAFQGIGDWLQSTGIPAFKGVVDTIKPFAPVLGDIATALIAAKVATTAWSVAIGVIQGVKTAWAAVTGVVTAAQWALNIAMDANPIGLIVIGVGALIAAFALLITHWDDVKAALGTGWDWLNDHVFKPIGAGVGALVNGVGTGFGWLGDRIGNIWQGIQDAISGAWNFIDQHVFTPIGTAIGNVKSWFGELGDKIRNVWDGITSTIAGVANSIKNAFKGAINWVIDRVNDVIGGVNFAIDLINHIPGVNIGYVGQLGHVEFAQGGIVTGPTRALIGEAGNEAVLPLAKIVPIFADAMISASRQVSQSASASQIYNSAYTSNRSSSTTYAPNYNLSMQTMQAPATVQQSFALMKAMA